MNERMMVTLLAVTFGCVAANFAWQIFTDQEWNTAVERSCFQIGAIIAVALSFYLMPIPT